METDLHTDERLEENRVGETATRVTHSVLGGDVSMDEEIFKLSVKQRTKMRIAAEERVFQTRLYSLFPVRGHLSL